MKTKNTNNAYGIPTSLLRFLGACVYGDAEAYYGGLNGAERAELEAQGKTFGVSAWFYRYLYKSLPEEKKADYRKIYQSRQVKAMIEARELKRLYGVLASHGLRFVPVKGADLAYRVYHDAALRSFCDWDIWFHPDDCERALAVLAEDGWKVPSAPLKSIAADQMRGSHCFRGHVREQYTLEPHFTLPNFNGIDPLEIWDHAFERTDGDGQRTLSPEMNLLMLTRHGATKSYFHAQLPKLLTDAAMVMRHGNVNFDELRKLAAGWALPYPGDFLAAFPEFFPSDVIAEFKADPQKTGVFRQMFELRSKLGDQETAALLLSRYEARGEITGSVMRHFRARTPGRMRLLYRLPEHGARGRLMWAYVSWFFSRIWSVRSWLRRNPTLRKYARFVETAESAQKS